MTCVHSLRVRRVGFVLVPVTIIANRMRLSSRLMSEMVNTSLLSLTTAAKKRV